MIREQINFRTFFRKLQPCCLKEKEEDEDDDDEEILKDYFGNCFDDLLSRMQIKQGKCRMNISKTIFSGFINLPLIISDRIFEAFEEVEKGDREYLSKTSFVDGMFNLFFFPSEKMEKLTFKIMDVDLKGEIKKEDVELLLTYLNNGCDNLVSNLEVIVKNFFSLTNSLKYEEYIKKIENENCNIFILLLMLIYSKQPFTDEVIKFFADHYKPKFRNGRTRSLTRSRFNVLIISPTDEIKLYLKYVTNGATLPRRKSSSKNLLQFSEIFENKMNFYSSFEDSSSSLRKDTDKGSSQSSLSTKNDSTNDLENTYFESLVYELPKSSAGKELIKTKIVLVDNNLFCFHISPNTNEYILEKVHPLSGCYFTDCEEVRLHNFTLFPVAILSQYGNTMANVNNVFLSTSLYNMRECIENLSLNMKIRSIDDYYQILSQVGQGTFSTVRIGRHRLSGEKVAIKIITKSNLSQIQFEMIKNEIDILNFFKKSPHPNIVTPIDIFEDKNFIYYVLELMQGGNLKSHLKEATHMEEFEVKNVVKQVASALSFMDKMGIVHRDIKPENILMKRNDPSIIKLSDFGLSTVKFNHQKTNENCGTLLYSAPELVMSLPYNRKIDVWSVGILTYFLIYGIFPFEGLYSTRKKLINKICREELKFPFRISEMKDCKYFIENCLRKNPLERFDIKHVRKSKFLSESCN